jgi:AcrR family transcriptional regulator
MGPSERRAREREELRTLILDAARELFAAEGVEAVTMRRIAERIEYSPTAIYFHFRDKDALLRELCDTDFRDFAQGFAAMAQIADPVERLKASGYAYIDLLSQVIWAGVHGVVSLEIAKCHDDWVDWKPMSDRARATVDMIVAGITR